MKKRAQAGEAVKYLLIAAVIIFVTFFGYSIVQKATDNACKAEIAKFGIALKDIDRSVKFGSVKEFTEQVPCNANEVYFFDLSQDINLDFLSHMPLLKDSIESKAEKNVFVVKDNKILGSFYAGNLDIGFPNYICFLPKFEKINFFLEGIGKAAAVFPGCLQPECTYIPVSADNAKAAAVIQEARDYGQSTNCPNCPAYYETVSQHFSNFVQTRENSEIFRKYEYCRETGKTNVEIAIKPKGDAELRNFRYYESIPKNCIDDLQAYLSNVEGDVSIKNDPLMVWVLPEIKSEAKVSYELDKILTDECKAAIKGMGIAEAVDNGRIVTVPEVPVVPIETPVQNTFPIIENIPDQEFGFSEQEQIIIADLSQYAADAETISQDLGYRITRQTNPNMVECSLMRNKEVWCISKQNIDSVTDITIEVSDGELNDQDTFRITLNPSIACGNGIVQGIEECDDSNNRNGDGCSSDCHTETCAYLNGFICGSSQFCPGSQLSAVGTERCCNVECQLPSGNSCNDCGNGLFNLCDRNECQSITGCFFTQSAIGFFGGECDSCSGITCESYSSQQTCNSDICGIGNCEWDNEDKCFAAVTPAPVCANECSSGQKRCLGGNNFQECNANPNNCLVWGPSQSCADGQVCLDGECIFENSGSDGNGDSGGDDDDGGGGDDSGGEEGSEG